MTDLNKAWVASEGLKRAERIVAQLAEDGAANNNLIGPVLQHRMRETIGREIDLALQQHPPIADVRERLSNGSLGDTTIYIGPDGEMHTADPSGVVGAVVHNEDVPRKTRGPKRKAGRGRKPAAGADA
jgi:hypothetical protein